MHLDTEQIERLLHRELAPGQEGLLRAHLEECSYCARRLEHAAEEEREIFASLRRLDHPVPPVSATEIAGRAAAGRIPWGRIAAGFVLVLATTGALFAVPGSPLPGLLRSALDREAATQPRATGDRPPYESGVAVRPGEEVDVVFVSRQQRGSATVRLVDDPDLSIRAIGQPVAFDVDLGRLTVLNARAEADYEIFIPRTARSVRVLVGAEVVLHKERDRVLSSAGMDPEGVYHVPMRVPTGP
jgi:hypothetical protein